MGTTAEKLTYLNTTKGKIKDSINLTGAGITNQDTFRSYASKLKLGLIDIINNGIDQLYSNFPKVSGIGSNLSLTPTYEAPMRNLPLGDTLQDGTPTPSSPIDIQSVTGLQNVNVCGKNLCDISQGFRKGYLNTNTGVFNSQNQSFVLNQYVQVIGGETYSYSLNENVTNMCIYSFNENKEYIKREKIVYSEKNIFVALDNNAKYIVLGGNYNNSTTITQEILNNLNIQLEKGTNTTYEPYKGNTYEVNLGNIELNKIGDYQDRIYKDNGKWYVEKKIGKVVLNGTENWRYQANYDLTNTKQFAWFSAVNTNSNIGLSNYFKRTEGWQTLTNTDEDMIQVYSDKSIYIRINNTLASDLATFKNWLSTHNTEVYYALATPTYTEITNTELINQLETLYTAKSQEGITNISITSEDLPMLLSASALEMTD